MMWRKDPGISSETLRRFRDHNDVQCLRDRLAKPGKRPMPPKAGHGIVVGQGPEETSETHPVGRSFPVFNGWSSPGRAAPAFTGLK